MKLSSSPIPTANLLLRNTRPSLSSPLTSSIQRRAVRYQAYDAWLDQDDLDEARKWHTTFNQDSLPRGQTKYSRSSGPGGQHVNKTETKATSVWPVAELSKVLPKLMCSALRLSRYYTVGNDSITIQSQTQRSRTANTEESRHKLVKEINRIYQEQVPGATSEKKIKKHEAVEKAFHHNRLQLKKYQSSKKASRRGGQND
ncbi:hypothetical protein F4679DRAFT_579109 [Xylaria curta]|nr:hypothetical protein F4679DRAFT_579109 [Xylaria curta]